LSSDVSSHVCVLAQVHEAHAESAQSETFAPQPEANYAPGVSNQSAELLELLLVDSLGSGIDLRHHPASQALKRLHGLLL
jgi:hypothetical protein